MNYLVTLILKKGAYQYDNMLDNDGILPIDDKNLPIKRMSDDDYYALVRSS